jgi:hypothetical protein
MTVLHRRRYEKVKDKELAQFMRGRAELIHDVEVMHMRAYVAPLTPQLMWLRWRHLRDDWFPPCVPPPRALFTA